MEFSSAVAFRIIPVVFLMATPLSLHKLLILPLKKEFLFLLLPEMKEIIHHFILYSHLPMLIVQLQ